MYIYIYTEFSVRGFKSHSPTPTLQLSVATSYIYIYTHTHIYIYMYVYIYMTHFGLGLLAHFSSKKSDKKNSQRFLNYIKSLCIIFCGKMSRYSHV